MSVFSLQKISLLCNNYRSENGLTQKQMAALLEINEQTYAKIEREQFFPTVAQIEKILDLTNSNLDDIKSPNNSHAFFVALKGNAKDEKEKIVLEKLISAILCLDKHKNIKEGSRRNE